jgi:uncharacterized protein (TIGR02594 family)
MTEPWHLTIARGLIGQREIPGPRHNQVLMDLFDDAAGWLGTKVTNDEDAWCGGFVAGCLARAGLDKPPRGFVGVRARAWADYGANLRASHVAPGAIVSLWRGNPNSPFGHVGFYVGEDNDHYHLLGGNQSNAVNVQRFPKARVLAIRWPRDVPVIGGPVRMSAAGVPVTNGNEA